MPSSAAESYLARYLAGEHVRVWTELFFLGTDVRAAGTVEDAWGVAVEAMRWVRANVEMVYGWLEAIGYPFEHPERAHRPPGPDDARAIARFEADFGPLPLALRACFEVVGSVDWTQDRSRSLPETIFALGDADPLLLSSFGDLLEQYEWERRPRRVPLLNRLFPLRYPARPRAVREFDFDVSIDGTMKGGYAGVGPWSIHLPDARADAPILFDPGPFEDRPAEAFGASPTEFYLTEPNPFRPGKVNEVWTFVTYLRKAFQGGGFLALASGEMGSDADRLQGPLSEGLLRF